MLENVLLSALQVIPPEPLTYEKYIGTSVNEIGMNVPQYAPPVEVKGSIQYHISEKMYQAYGLDLNKDYALVDIPAEVVGVETNKTPDRLTFHGKQWIVVKTSNWFKYNGWVKLLCVSQKTYTGEAK